MSASAGSALANRSALPARTVVFLMLWLVVMGPAPKDLPIGLLAALASAWSSLYLWPPGPPISLFGAIRFVGRFLWQSVVAGVGVAYLAFFRAGNLSPGLATYRPSVPAGMARRAFCAVMSLQPGKLPVGVADDGALLIHCLDGTESAAEEIAADERACLAMIAPAGP